MTVSTCCEIGCDKPVEGRGLCMKHYAQIRRTQRKTNGLCVLCGKPRDLGYETLCEECATRIRRDKRAK